MRFEKRWSNGYWKLFDTERYTSVQTYRTEKECMKAVIKANSIKEKK